VESWRRGRGAVQAEDWRVTLADRVRSAAALAERARTVAPADGTADGAASRRGAAGRPRRGGARWALADWTADRAASHRGAAGSSREEPASAAAAVLLYGAVLLCCCGAWRSRQALG